MDEPGFHGQDFVKKITEIITTNLGNVNFNAKELARLVGLTLPRLNRRLLNITGKTASHFIREARLQAAMNMLKNEEVTASEVAFRTGFSSPAYFNTCFHRFFGIPPGHVIKVDPETASDKLFVPDTSAIPPRIAHLPPKLTFVAGFIIITVIVYLIYTYYSENHLIKSDDKVKYQLKSMAVLPIKNLGNDPEDQHFYDGIQEEIYSNLCKIHEIRVIFRTSVEQYRNSVMSAPEIARDLNVNYLVESSGQMSGNKIKLRVQLISVKKKKERHIWANSYEVDIPGSSDFFRKQSHIAQVIASELNATITPEEKILIEKASTQSTTAYALYLKATNFRKEFEKNRSPDSYEAAASLYIAATETDPSFAKAYTGLAFCYWERHYRDDYFEVEFLDSCLNLADKALILDNRLDEAYYLKGRYYAEHLKTNEALENYDMALGINPSYYPAYIYKSYLLAWDLADYTKALENYHKALDFIYGNERSAILRNLGNLYINA